MQDNPMEDNNVALIPPLHNLYWSIRAAVWDLV
jgi:hypothetical protein